jgi:hypothetical protein
VVESKYDAPEQYPDYDEGGFWNKKETIQELNNWIPSKSNGRNDLLGESPWTALRQERALHFSLYEWEPGLRECNWN